MMKLPALAIALVTTWIVIPAQARGIDCSKAATKLEKTICGDARLLRADEEMSGAYVAALQSYGGKLSDYVRRDQLNWRQDFTTIGKPSGEIEPMCAITEKSCILEALHRRSEALGSGTYRNSGVYRSAKGFKLLLYPQRGNGFILRAFDPQAGQHSLQTLNGDETSAMWDGPDFMVAKMGDGSGLPLPDVGPEGDHDGCELRLLPSMLSIRVFQKGWCDGQDFAGIYQRQTAELLADYEIDLH